MTDFISTEKYVLSTNDSMRIQKPKEQMSRLERAKPLILTLAAVALVAGIISGFEVSSWGIVIVAGITVISTLLVSRKTEVPTEMDITFFDDSIELFRPDYIYSKKEHCQIRVSFAYADIHECVWDKKSCTFTIYGINKREKFRLLPNMDAERMPYFSNTSDSMDMFSTVFSENVDFKKEFESHSPLSITIKE